MKKKKQYNPIRQLREELGMSQHEFGGLIGRSSVSVRGYEKHLEETPRDVMEKIRAIAGNHGFVDIVMELIADSPQGPTEGVAEQSETPSTLNAKSTIEPKLHDPLTSDSGVCQNASHQRWQQQIDALVEILSTPDPLARSALMSNLEYFRVAVRNQRTIDLAGLGKVGSEAAEIPEVQGRFHGGSGGTGGASLSDTQWRDALSAAKAELGDDVPPEHDIRPEVSAGDKGKGQSVGRDDRAGKLGGRG